MLIRLTRPHLLPDGEIGEAGQFHELADDAAYGLIWKGAAIPSLRLRVLRDGLYGDRHFAAGDLICWPPPDWSRDWPAKNSVDPGRFDTLTAVVPIRETGYLDGDTYMSHAAGAPVVVDAFRAWEMVRDGARYATPDEAAALLPPLLVRPEPTASAEPIGPTVRLYASANITLQSGRLVRQDTFFDAPADEVDGLVESKSAVRLVKARVTCDSALVGTTSCSRGDIVEVPPFMAKQDDRFEPVAAAGKVAAATGKLADAAEGLARRVTGRRAGSTA